MKWYVLDLSGKYGENISIAIGFKLTFFQCTLCLDELLYNITLSSYALTVGLKKK